MTIQEQLQALIATATTASVFPIVATQDAPYPHITYQRISSRNENVMDGNGSTPISNCRMQIDVWAKTYAQAQALNDHVATAMKGWSVQNVQISSRDLYESDVKIYRMSMDYSIWYY
jgi:hypothetical protein